MYITSDLFGGHAPCNHGEYTTPAFWNTMAEPPHTAGLGKRKRHEAAEEGVMPCSLTAHDAHKNDAQSRYMHQQRLSPARRRAHAHNTSLCDNIRTHLPSTYSPSPIHTPLERRPVKQMKRLGTKAPLIKSTSHLMDIETELPASSSTSGVHQQLVTDLRPCHACQSAPRRRKDLENYLDCRRCDGRTCYICARQCLGGCGKAVCKKCIVEVGHEGDAWCLDCYSHNINC